MTPHHMVVSPTTLRGDSISLLPLEATHIQGLATAAGDPRIWTFLDEPVPPDSYSAMEELVSEALEEQRDGHRVAFVIEDNSSGSIIGSISYIDIQPKHRQVEIGWAWLTPAYWRTGASRQAAYLLMRHAFEDLGAIRVAFKTDARNTRSQKAISRLGATQEGVFRNHRILRDGFFRDSIFYSVIKEEWNVVKANLEEG